MNQGVQIPVASSRLNPPGLPAFGYGLAHSARRAFCACSRQRKSGKFYGFLIGANGRECRCGGHCLRQ
jgi:hypothetical protein